MSTKSLSTCRGCQFSSLMAKAAIAGTTLAAAMAVAGLTGANRARADVVIIANPVVIPATVNLSAGTTDWADFGGPNFEPGGSITPTFNSAVNTAFSNVVNVGGSSSPTVTTGYAATSPSTFSWSDGTPTATAADSDEYATDNNGNVAGAGLQFTQNVAGNSSELVNVYVLAYDNGTGNVLPVSLTAQLGSDPAVSNSSNMPFVVDAYHQNGVYGISIQNTSSSSQILTVTYTQTTSPGSTGMYAVSAMPVPEPATLGLFGIGVLGLLLLKRRKAV
ncbi:MAG: PEP-CTERM sorting domain-containing protein [Phycisphaerae bacterium]